MFPPTADGRSGEAAPTASVGVRTAAEGGNRSAPGAADFNTDNKKQNGEPRSHTGAGGATLCAVESMFAEKKEQEPMGSVRVAVVGVGNCAASLVQGVH